jgi:hypothetical protein
MRVNEKTLSLEQCCILLPKAKFERFPEVFAHLFRELRSEFGGYTFSGEVRGSWIERVAGIVHDDHNLVILVEIPAVAVSRGALKSLLSHAARDLDELSLFVSVSGGATFFVWAAGEHERFAAGEEAEASSVSVLVDVA